MMRIERAPMTLRRMLLALVLMLLAVEGHAQPAPAVGDGPSSWLVMPLSPADNDPRSLWLGEGLTLLIGDGLTALGRPAVPRMARVRSFEALDLPTGAVLSRATLIRAGQVLGVRHLVTGSIAADGDRLQVRLRSVDVDRGEASSEIVEDGGLRELVDVAERAARRLAGLPAEVGADETRAIEPPPSLEVFEAFVKGLVAETPATQRRFLLDAVRQAPGYGRAQVALWEVCTELQDHARALEAARAVRPTSRFARRAQFFAALSLLHLSRFDEAFTAFAQLNDAEPSAALFNNLGVVQVRRGAASGAGTPAYYFNKAAELGPEVADYFFNLGYAYWLDRDMPAAIYWLREVVRRRPGDGVAHYVLGAALQASGATAEAARERDLARRLSSTFAEWEKRAAADPAGAGVPRGLERLVDTLEAVPVQLDTALVTATQQEYQQLARFHYDRGMRLAEQQQDREAASEFRKSIYLAPYAPETHLALGRVLVRAGRLRDAVESLTISLWSAESIDARVLLADALLSLGDPAAALPHAERAVQLAPDHATARDVLERTRAALAPKG
jgi:tetratricopeptide (TPR) repeat protein/TolB-like protein